VLRDRRLRHPRAIRQRAHGLLAVADQVLVDRATGRVGESLEKIVGSRSYGGIIAIGL
jgi:hypothetical protein